MGGLGNEVHYFSKCQNPSLVKARKEFIDLTKFQIKIQSLTKYLKLKMNYRYVGKFLHSLLEKYEEESDHIIMVNS